MVAFLPPPLCCHSSRATAPSWFPSSARAVPGAPALGPVIGTDRMVTSWKGTQEASVLEPEGESSPLPAGAGHHGQGP